MNPSGKNVCVGRCSFVGNLFKERNLLKCRRPCTNMLTNRKTSLFVVGIVQLLPPPPPSKWPNTNWECNILYHDRLSVRVPTVSIEFLPTGLLHWLIEFLSHYMFPCSFQRIYTLFMLSVWIRLTVNDIFISSCLFFKVKIWFQNRRARERREREVQWKQVLSIVLVFGRRLLQIGSTVGGWQANSGERSFGAWDPLEFVYGRDCARMGKCTANTCTVWPVLASLKNNKVS